MEVFIVVLILLLLIGVSNVIYRFVPFVPVPLIQIILGACITVIPQGIHLMLQPELFFILFIAPLLYNDGKHTPRAELWRLITPILLLSVGLVFATVFVVGYTIHWMIPTIPLFVAFAFAAILSPTDSVAVNSLAGRINLPKSLIRLLEGEGLMNDASGLVAFKFAIAAAVTGVFSLQKASLSFLIISIGGLIVGAAIAFLIIGIRQLLRRAGLEDATMHILIQLLTPFLLYLIAEQLNVSGILAAVAGGIVHAIENDRIECEISNIKVVSNNTWAVYLFILNGLVFVILGTQIPDVSSVIFKDPGFNDVVVIGYAIVIFAILLVLRFIWTFLFTRGSKVFGTASEETTSIKEIVMTTLSGVRGAVTLAGAFSMPLMLHNGELFPQRHLIIFLSTFVILLSLLAASILLPLIAKKTLPLDDTEMVTVENEWHKHILEAAVRHLQQESNQSNEEAVEAVIAEYNRLIHQLGLKGNSTNRVFRINRMEVAMRIEAIGIERNYVREKFENGDITKNHAQYYYNMLDQVEIMLTSSFRMWLLVFKRLLARLQASFFLSSNPVGVLFTEQDVSVLRGLRIQSGQKVIDQMGTLCTPESKNDPSQCVVAYYKQILNHLKNLHVQKKHRDQDFDETRKELHWLAVQAERYEVQNLYEQGKIDRGLAAQLRRIIRDREVSLYERIELG
ncbi:Na+/H+ antiporter [Paenibacillus sp. CGMCC 1.16610]|uniref:Na+/H+ antiporter n=1 Tax=Paenibacillus anseongense TaxID=2682845 RepID=A0ABW9U9T6_9BACL|nr:Na+/H+ antiporter [Paenibacillus anseongense]MBA2937144.1 Na+/H+ antiporter [Paenibacillus sp. CGMCC 1.16610]MVQ36206.1 Na+/H+ antiporter [Paenibacillus anseongense]